MKFLNASNYLKFVHIGICEMNIKKSVVLKFTWYIKEMFAY